MRIHLMASGTRGDVQPMIALGKALRDSGHEVVVVAGSNFMGWIESHGLKALPTVDMEALMQSELGVKWVEEPNAMKQLGHMKALMNSIADEVIAITISATEGAELIISGFVTEAFTQAICEKRGVPQISLGLQPYRATRSGPASLLAPFPRANNVLNRFAGRFAERIAWSMSAPTAQKLRQKLGLPPHTTRSYVRAAHRIPALYAFSPAVVPPVDDANAHTTGFWFLDEAYTPPDDLTRFIEAGEPPLYIGFGSMSSSDPTRTVQMVAEALKRIGRRGILARGWSGAQVSDVPNYLQVLDHTSHTWLFPRMAAVVHHGGAGTTAAGLRAGVPSLIIPHMADQPFWGRRVHHLGVGVKPIERHKLTLESLTASLDALVNDRQIASRAADLGARIRDERGVDNAVDWINAYIGQSEQKILA